MEAALVLAGLALGAVIGRWWAILLPFAIPIALLPVGEDSDGAPYWGLALTFTVPLLIAGVAVGVGLRKAAVSSKRRRDRSAAS